LLASLEIQEEQFSVKDWFDIAIRTFEEETSGEAKGLAGCQMFVEARILGEIPDMRANLDAILGNI